MATKTKLTKRELDLFQVLSDASTGAGELSTMPGWSQVKGKGFVTRGYGSYTLTKKGQAKLKSLKRPGWKWYKAAGQWEYGMPPKKKNRCYGARYGGRYRNLSVPQRRVGESWVDYHDRLSGMAAVALKQGHTQVAEALERRAGQVASKHPAARKKPRGRGASGPGTYPWSQCIKDARSRGATDPKAVCGAIRARSRKKYPVYWKARHKKARNPSREDHARTAYTAMEGGAINVAYALGSSSPKMRMEYLLSAAMFAGQALAEAQDSGDSGLVAEATEFAKQVGALGAEAPAWRAKKNPRCGKKSTKKKSTRKKNTGAVMRSFMRLT